MEEGPLTQFDEERAAAYDGRIRRLAPGYEVLHESLASFLSTILAADAHLLIVGAGTGAEIIELGHMQASWQFTAVDPSVQMMGLCRSNVREAGLDSRVEYVYDRVENLSDDHFDAATSIFVSHFIHDGAAKRRFFRSIASRLRSQAPFILADLYRSGSGAEFDQLMAAWREHLIRTGSAEEDVEHTFDRIQRGISFLREAELERVVGEAGFGPLTRFHQCFLWGRGGRESPNAGNDDSGCSFCHSNKRGTDWPVGLPARRIADLDSPSGQGAEAKDAR